jgi:hypothetical protein
MTGRENWEETLHFENFLTGSVHIFEEGEGERRRERIVRGYYECNKRRLLWCEGRKGGVA